jgi:hypothetical protein
MYSYLWAYLIKHHDVKTYESADIAPLFLTPAQDGGHWSDLCPCFFTFEETAPGNHYTGR